MGWGKTRVPASALVLRRHHLTQNVVRVVFQKSPPPQICQPTLYYYKYKEQIDGYVWKLTFAKRLHKHFVSDKTDACIATDSDAMRALPAVLERELY